MRVLIDELVGEAREFVVAREMRVCVETLDAVASGLHSSDG